MVIPILIMLPCSTECVFSLLYTKNSMVNCNDSVGGILHEVTKFTSSNNLP